MKYFTYIFTTCAMSFYLAAPLQSRGLIDERKIEPALIEVLYERIRVTDTLLVDTDFETHFLTLMAGKNVSAFYSADLKTSDSLECRSREYFRTIFTDMDLFRRLSHLENEAIFRNYPTGKTTCHTRRYAGERWIYEEEWEKPVWQITDSTSTIGGYECLLAVTEYRGRCWHAWFTPEIAISEGPWKLCGLPGLILEARDDRNHYRYSARAITLNPGKDVEYFNYSDRLKTDRITSLKDQRKALQVSIKNQILSSGAYGISPNVKPDKIDKSKPLPHRNYDFEETDYPHE